MDALRLPLRLSAALASIALASCASAPSSGMLGSALPPGSGARHVAIGSPDGRANATHGEPVEISCFGQSFAWRFSGPAEISEIDIGQIAPPGFPCPAAKIYLRRDPLIDGG